MPGSPHPKKEVKTQKLAKETIVAGDRKGVKRRKRTAESYGRYIYHVLQSIDPGLSISSKTMSTMNGFVNDMFERIANEASKLAKMNKKKTIGSREIEFSVRLVISGELGKHAILEGTKALSMYNRSKASPDSDETD